MKTKLLLFSALLCSALSFAQFNIFEGFESGTLPTGWNTIGFVPNATEYCSGTASMSMNTVIQANGEITTESYTSNGTAITLSVKYKNTNPGYGSVRLQYSTNGTVWTNLSLANPLYTSCEFLTGTIVAGTIAAGTNVSFKIIVSRGGGSNQFTAYIDDFKATQLNTDLLISEYSFNSTLSNSQGIMPFQSNSNLTYVNDRNGNTNSALNINDEGTTAIIPLLPYGSSARSVSLWVKLNNFKASGFNFLYHYGTSAGGNGATFNATSVTQFAPNSSHVIAIANNIDTWYHFVFVYDGTNSKIYKNGALTTLVQSWNTVNNSDIFKLGLTELGSSTFFNGVIDDLKIYKRAISDTEVTNLYNNNTLTSDTFNQNNLQVSLYPNPANDVLNIEMANEVKSVEIYNIQGQKVLSSTQKQLNVADLSSGMYMIKVQDTNNAIATKKFVKQ